MSLECGGRRFGHKHAGGETIDSLTCGCPPTDRACLIISRPLSAISLNMVTMRGDRMRTRWRFSRPVPKGDDLEPRLLSSAITGRYSRLRLLRSDVTHSADASATCTTRPSRRMNDGRTSGPRWRDHLPTSLVGEAHGRVDWSVRAI